MSDERTQGWRLVLFVHSSSWMMEDSGKARRMLTASSCCRAVVSLPGSPFSSNLNERSAVVGSQHGRNFVLELSAFCSCRLSAHSFL